MTVVRIASPVTQSQFIQAQADGVNLQRGNAV